MSEVKEVSNFTRKSEELNQQGITIEPSELEKLKSFLFGQAATSAKNGFSYDVVIDIRDGKGKWDKTVPSLGGSFDADAWVIDPKSKDIWHVTVWVEHRKIFEDNVSYHEVPQKSHAHGDLGFLTSYIEVFSENVTNPHYSGQLTLRAEITL